MEDRSEVYEQLVNLASQASTIAAMRFSNDFLLEIEYHLEGYKRHNGELIRITEPLMNEIGINKVMSILNMYCHTGIWLSYLEDTNINAMLRQITLELCKVFAGQEKKYGMRLPWTTILWMIMDNIHSSLKKAEKGRFARDASTAIRSIEQFTVHESNKSPSKFPSLSLSK